MYTIIFKKPNRLKSLLKKKEKFILEGLQDKPLTNGKIVNTLEEENG